MTAFGWKRKIGEKIDKNSGIRSIFNPDEDSDSRSSSSVDWPQLFKKKKTSLGGENKEIKSAHLKEEGAKLAEKGLFVEAIQEWDQALELTPTDAKLLEMKAQALMQSNQSVPALQAARRAVMCDPCWWVAYQTLGHAQLGVGDIKMAIISFSKALHLNPVCKELWKDDLDWARKLLQEKEKLSQQSPAESDEDAITSRVIFDENGVVKNKCVPHIEGGEHPDVVPCRF